MISSKYQPINKAWREYSPKKIFKFLKTIFFSIKWLFRYSGLEFICTKFNPPKNPQTLPTGFIWLIGIYLAFFGVASQRHDSRIDIIENRANSIFAQLAVPSVAKKALSRIPRVQNMSCPYKPSLLNPLSVFISLFSDSKYEEVRAQLKETIEDWKDSLDSVNLSEAILRGADLREANLRGAKLQRADLRGANLQRASLLGADLQRAFLPEADLLFTNLWGADLRRADLRGANLWRTGFQNANLGGANLQGANLRDAFLQGANLRNAFLQEADFRGANLRGANLREADLGGAKELTVEQLCEASILYDAKLDQELEAQIKHECSDLLKEPQTTKDNTSGEKK
jgi:uncharacterized protein YjbI with pentapeptide repeats